MGRIYKNLKPIPLPAGAHVNHYDNRVFQEYKDGGRRCKRTIGVLAKEGTMHVNDIFRRHYPDLWTKYYGKIVPPMSQVKAGLYAITLGIATKTGIYKLLIDSFGPQHANAILDYAMYSIRFRSDTTQLFPVEMEDQMLFSRKPWSDSAYSELFSRGMTADEIHAFRTLWLKHCEENWKREVQEEKKPTKVWLCIDASNNDCAVTESELVGVGHAKSHRNFPVVSFIWAVDAETGRPLTWFVNNGKTPDCNAVDAVLKFVSSEGMQVEGVIMDRSFAAGKVLNLALEKKLKYIVMLKSDSAGFSEMILNHSEDVRWKIEHTVGMGEALFGITDKVRLFASDTIESCVGLFFSGYRSWSMTTSLIRKVQLADKTLRCRIATGADKIEAPVGVGKFVNLDKIDGKVVDFKWNFKELQKTADSYGFHAIASSEMMSAERIHELYELRDVSEKQFSILKSQLGCDTTRVHTDKAIESRYAISFVAAVIRTEIEIACKELGLDTNDMIRRLDRIRMMRMTGGQYEAIQDIPTDMLKLLKRFGICPAHFQKFAGEVNEQEQKPVYDQYREIPSIERPHRGRRPGSKNKKTLEREARERELAATGVVAEEKPRRKPGRPKGSRNKKTLAREAALKAMADAGMVVERKVERKPGRPKGSKNKKTLAREAEEKARQEKSKRRMAKHSLEVVSEVTGENLSPSVAPSKENQPEQVNAPGPQLESHKEEEFFKTS